ncbi:unnamed protein product [Phytomonas sp. EM1]|nr:unnamed protein product [Phytomonas sp. EM1]|eukprot:CCW61965.1 unnamed protein product [Phytomonas sp. isolate EM1]
MQLPFKISTSVTAPPVGFMSVTLVGTGASSGIPIIGHINADCACQDAIDHPEGNPNQRLNVSLLITVPHTAKSKLTATDEKNAKANTTCGDQEENASIHNKFGGEFLNQIDGVPVRFTLIDCGKTFRDAYFKVLARHGMHEVDALLLTHDHADAIMGLDDLRDLQRMHMVEANWIVDTYIPTYLQCQTMHIIEKSVGYIFRNSQIVGPAPKTASEHKALLREHVEREKHTKGENAWNDIGIRRATALQFFTVSEETPARLYIPALNTNDAPELEDANIPMYSLPVEHGKNYISLGFVFGRGTAFKSQLVGATGASTATPDELTEKSCVVYISDVSSIPEVSMKFLLDLVKIDLLIIDCVHCPGKVCHVHITMDEMAELVVQLKPRYAIAVGMYCDIKHDAGNAWLQDALEGYVRDGRLKAGEVLGMSLGYDGMELILPQ